MLRSSYSTTARFCKKRDLLRVTKFSSSAPSASYGPNAPLDLDPSLQDLLKDANMALIKHKPREKATTGTSAFRELEVLEFDETWPSQIVQEDEEEVMRPKERKSARAAFGSRGIGSVFLPAELRDAIERIINDKPRLHEDAKRLFREEGADGSELWHTNYETDYKSWRRAARHADRDGTAFASVALPAHYSTVYAVLENLKDRLGSDWKIKHVLDWGSGVGSGLWASMHAFQRQPEDEGQSTPIEPVLSRSTISSYLAFDKRDGLSAMAKRLVQGKDICTTKITWNRGFSIGEEISHSGSDDVLALSAFHLSSLPSQLARKEMIKQMWSSGANIIVLIDHDSSSGFESIVEAREYLLRMGKRELEDPATQDRADLGCHVVAPCPHDGICPLFADGPSKLKCTFSQRLQRPAFLRTTKRARAGHEDIGYSYVVIRRGRRPSRIDTSSRTGIANIAPEQNDTADTDSAHQIRLEAYDWPRLVFPPLKKSGHVILDGCTSEGQIMRMTIPRSQGKQPYYDARKSSWGDIFPHKPKNPPQVRHQPSGKNNDPSMLPGADIGKRRSKQPKKQVTGYDKIFSDLKENKRRRNRSRDKNDKFEDI
ncbi:Rsm22-domain-containing protein [Phellopilus nigrolimitatus]|nr:Rsm22-domain-containing protein [Phellopilus nigrolimitatus]